MQHIQRLPVKRQIRVVDAVRQLPGLGVQVDFRVGFAGGRRADVGDEVVLFAG